MSKRKKNNNFKRAQRVFQNSRIWSWESDVGKNGIRVVYAESRQGFIWKPISHKLTANMSRLSHNWTIVCRAICQAGDHEWIESEAVSIKQFKLDDLAEHYESMRESVLESVQKRHVVDVGWLAHTWGKVDPIDKKNLENIHAGSASEQRQLAWKLAQTIEEKEAA